MAHYSLAHKPRLLKSWAANAAPKLRARIDKELGRDTIPMFVYRGMSGVAHATALSLEWDRRYKAKRALHGMVYVRKPNEQSHGNRVQVTVPYQKVQPRYVLVFVDDFISSGDTFTAAMSAAIRELEVQNFGLNVHQGCMFACIGDGETDFAKIREFDADDYKALAARHHSQ